MRVFPGLLVILIHLVGCEAANDARAPSEVAPAGEERVTSAHEHFRKLSGGLQSRASSKFPPLVYASGRGNFEEVAQLLSSGADVDAPASGGITPLMAAAATGDLPVVEQLLSAGADLELEEHRHGSTALVMAATQGHAPIVTRLMAAGAKVNPRARQFAADAGYPRIVAILQEPAMRAARGDAVVEEASVPRAGASSASGWPGGLLDADLPMLADLVAAMLVCTLMCSRRLMAWWKSTSAAARPEPQAQAQAEPEPEPRLRRKRVRMQRSQSAEPAATARASVEQPCVVCLTAPRTMSFVHGDSAHLCCCADCAAAVQAQRQPCPLCRRPIYTIVRQFW